MKNDLSILQIENLQSETIAHVEISAINHAILMVTDPDSKGIVVDLSKVTVQKNLTIAHVATLKTNHEADLTEIGPAKILAIDPNNLTTGHDKILKIDLAHSTMIDLEEIFPTNQDLLEKTVHAEILMTDLKDFKMIDHKNHQEDTAQIENLDLKSVHLTMNPVEISIANQPEVRTEMTAHGQLHARIPAICLALRVKNTTKSIPRKVKLGGDQNVLALVLRNRLPEQEIFEPMLIKKMNPRFMV